MIGPGVLIDDRFEILKMIKSGSYGTVTLVQDHMDNTQKAMKLIPRVREKGLKDYSFQMEVDSLKALKQVDQVVNLLVQGIYLDYRFLVLDLLSDDLESIRCRNVDQKFTHVTIFKYLWHAITTIEMVHKYGIIHRDLKPDNWMIKYAPKETKLILVDFSLSCRNRTPDGERLPSDSSQFQFSYKRGTHYPPCYEDSIYMEKEDLISIGFSCLFLRNVFPWSNRDLDEMRRLKRQFIDNPSLQLRDEDIIFESVLREVFHQEDEETLNYDAILKIIKTELELVDSSTEIKAERVDGKIFLE